MHAFVVTCEFVLPVETVLAAKFAPEHAAWEFGSLGAMLGSIVSFQVTELLGEMAAIYLGALVISLIFEMGTLMAAVYLVFTRAILQRQPFHSSHFGTPDIFVYMNGTWRYTAMHSMNMATDLLENDRAPF